MEAQAVSLESAPWERTTETLRFLAYSNAIEARAIVVGDSHAGPPGLALDIGCEAGRFSQLLARRGWDLICTDINEHALALCRQRLPRARCVRAEPGAASLPAENSSLGMILCIEVPPVICAEWFADEALRVLRPGGVLVGVFWNLLSWRGAMHRLRIRMHPAQSWYYPMAYREWRSRMKRRGFEFIHQEGFCWAPFRSRLSDSPLVPLTGRVESALGLRRMAALSPLIAFAARKCEDPRPPRAQ